jgi:hypothetical protein
MLNAPRFPIYRISVEERILDREGVDGLPVLEVFGEKNFGAAGQCGGHNQAVVIPEAKAGVDGDGFGQKDFAWKNSAAGPKLKGKVV